MIPADIFTTLHEMSDPTMCAAVAKFIRAAKHIEDSNDPRTTHDGGRGGKPGSRPPGRLQCQYAVKRIVQLAQDADNAWGNLTAKLETHDAPITHMGGMEIPAAGPSVGRRAKFEASTHTRLIEAAAKGAQS